MEKIRFLVKINIFASFEGKCELIGEKTVESDSATCVYMPKINLFRDGVEISITLEVLEQRIYKESTFNTGMIELVNTIKYPL